MKYVMLFLLLFISQISPAQNKTNIGRDFWLGYPTSLTTATDDMTIYLSCDGLPAGLSYATVTITVDSSSLTPAIWWQRIYHLPAYSVIDISKTAAFSFSPASTLAIGPLPKSLCQLYSPACPFGNGGTGVFRNKGIHITSDVDISVLTKMYIPTSAGATMVLPTNSLGYNYTVINSAQNSVTGGANFFFIVANEDSTRVKITASNFSNATASCVTTIPNPLSSYTVELQKGHIYQYVGYTNSSNDIGVELTGSKIQSIPNADGVTKKISVFAGSTRTGGESGGGCSASSRDNDLQQCYPENSWGKKYALVPFVTSTGTINTTTFSGCIYKIIAKDTGTYVSIGGSMTIPLSTIGSYKFSASTPKYVEANKPIMIAQFMTSGNCNTGDGDPEMIYLNPLEQAVNKASFYRTSLENISSNFVTIVIPDSGLTTLNINGQGQASNWGGNATVKAHPELIGYKVVVKGWLAANSQCFITSNAKFTAYTYGLGGAESYGYSCGANFDDIYSKLTIKGSLITPLNKKVKLGNLSLSGTNMATSLSDTNGVYSVNATEGNYTLRPTKNNDITKANGVTSIDALLTQRHILNATKLNSPYKIIAADVDGNKLVNSVDVLRMKRLILGTDTTFTKTVGTVKTDRLWEFVDSAYTFPDTTNPFPFKDSISFTNLTSNKINQTFIGVKLGDVNYDWNPAVARGVVANSLELIVNSEKQTNNNLQLSFSSSNFNNINALQTTLHFDNTKYEFIGIENGKLQLDCNANKANTTGNIAILWTDKNAEAKSFDKDEVLFTVVLKPRSLGIGNLEFVVSNDMVETEAWDNNSAKRSIVLTQKAKSNKQEIQNNLLVYPNPAKDKVIIESVGAKQILIVDYLGRPVLSKTITNNQKLIMVNLPKGIYTIRVLMKDESLICRGLVVI